MHHNEDAEHEYNETKNNNNNNNNTGKDKSLVMYSDFVKPASNIEKTKISDSKSINNNSNNNADSKKTQKISDNTKILQPTPHPLLVDNKNKNSKKSSNDYFNESLFYKNENLNFNAQNEKVIQFDHGFATDRQQCNYDENCENENDRMPISFNKIKFAECSQAKNAMKRYNSIFYNGISTNIDRDTPEYQGHAGELLKFLSSLWMTRKMCDLAIKIDNRKYLAHKLGLAMFSRKYREEFNSENNKPEENGIYTIKLTHTSDAALEAILSYIYTAEIDINPENADEILNGAKELGIDNLICMTQDYLNSLSIGDILIFMANVFDKDGGDLIAYQIYAYIMRNLNKIARTPEFARISICAVKSILGDSNLQVSSETEVFDAALKWINYDKSKRQKHLPEIMRSVRFSLMSPHEIHTRTESQPVFLDNKELTLMILNALKYHAFKCYSDSILSNMVKSEEQRSLNLNGSSVPDNFIHALKELANKACILKSERTNASTNVAKFIQFNDNCCGKKVNHKVCSTKKETLSCNCVQSKLFCPKQRNCCDAMSDDMNSNSSNSVSTCSHENLKKVTNSKKLYEECKDRHSKINEHIWNLEFGKMGDCMNNGHDFELCAKNSSCNNNNNSDFKNINKTKKNSKTAKKFDCNDTEQSKQIMYHHTSFTEPKPLFEIVN